MTSEEELEKNELWSNFLSTGKSEYRDELIVHHLFLVKYVVGRIGGLLPTHVKLDDLYSSGITGLVRAVEKFDPAKTANLKATQFFSSRERLSMNSGSSIGFPGVCIKKRI